MTLDNPGVITLTAQDANGNRIVITENFTQSTGVLVDRAVSTTTGTKTGALVVDNQTGKTQAVTCTADDGTVKTFSIPAAGAVLTAAQLAGNNKNNGGPITTISDLAGITPTIA